MKRIGFLLSFILILSVLTAFGAYSEDCEHVFSHTSSGESGHITVCSLCGETRSDAHNLVYEYKGATCLSPAVILYKCTVCQYAYSYTEGEKNPGHAWGEFEIVRSASCRQAGLQQRSCPDCGQVESAEIAPLEHNYGEWKPYDETQHIRYCKECNWAYKDSHSLNDGEITAEPTESQLGIIRYTCRVCGHTFENIIRQDGAIYEMETVDVLSDGASYLLAASRSEDNASISEIVLSDGNALDIRPMQESVFSVYANVKTGNYAGICVESGESDIDIIPKADFDTSYLEFLLLKKNARVNLRIFNACGAIEFKNLNGARVIIAQHKNEDGSIVTLLMRFTEKRDSVECEAEIHQSDGAVISIANSNGEYAFTLPEGDEKIASLTYKYQRKTGKITVNPRNRDNNANGTAVYILEGIEFMRTAQNTKTCETYVQLADESGMWRLRATFPSGYTLETPLFYKDGAYAYKTSRYLMDEKALGALMLIDPAPVSEEENTYLKMPETPEETPKPTPVPRATEVPAPVFEAVNASEAETLKETNVALLKNDIKAFVSADAPGVVIQYSSMHFHVNLQEENEGVALNAVKLVEQGASFKIQNAYSFPATFRLADGTTSVSIRAEIRRADGKIQEISLGEYTISR